ncbi:hypothetical protein [Streptomyces sp. RFCAC02]|uniref:hypothetical protein n=1 Tax=Streptomyces sp. RFCAC02 TaxID=2499143 RepID=UPI001020184A|nr:hypothetical protein [Streptomyces sp. RFCAC02]
MNTGPGGRRRTRAVGALTAALLLPALAACGGGDTGPRGIGAFVADDERPTTGATDAADDGGTGAGTGFGADAAALAERAMELLTEAESVRVAITTTTPQGVVRADLSLDRDADCSGTFSSDGQGEFELRRRGDDVWIRPDRQMWEDFAGGAVGEAELELFVGRWLKGDPDDPDMAAQLQMCDLAALQGDMRTDTGEPGSPVERGENTTFDGRPAIELLDGTTTMLVAAEGEPYPLQMRGMDVGGPMDVAFHDWNLPVDVEPPPAGLVLDFSGMPGPGDLEV